jgi:hypothetical protein
MDLNSLLVFPDIASTFSERNGCSDRPEVWHRQNDRQESDSGHVLNIASSRFIQLKHQTVHGHGDITRSYNFHKGLYILRPENADVTYSAATGEELFGKPV